jgi:hypothetical protein
MKTMILTGLATEQSFNNGGEARYFLVFNNGELRVPITEEAAEIVVAEMMKEESAVRTYTNTGNTILAPEIDDTDFQDESLDEAGVAQV